MVPNKYLTTVMEVVRVGRTYQAGASASVSKKERDGRTELIYLKPPLFEIAERARRDLGLTRSGFYRFCVIRTLQELGYLNAEKIEALKANEEV